MFHVKQGGVNISRETISPGVSRETIRMSGADNEKFIRNVQKPIEKSGEM